jgi:von Willebrand factor A domain-containing protein 7
MSLRLPRSKSSGTAHCRARAARIACAALALLMAAAPPPAGAFAPTNGLESVFGISGTSHEDITEHAVRLLAQEFFGTTRQTRSMKKAARQIAKGNASVDEVQSESFRHFDSEDFAGSMNWINTHAANVLSALNDENAEGARRELGMALHTIQDFYSHSNWIELGHTGPNPNVGRPGGRLDPPTVTYCVDCIPCVDCDGNIIGNQLVTGYYGGQGRPNPGNRCRHGGITDTGPGPSGGINKDTNACAISPHCAFHGAAANAAMGATMEFIRSIKDRVSEKQLKQLFGVGPRSRWRWTRPAACLTRRWT